MQRNELAELHFMTHIDNIASLLQHGILCFDSAATVPHRSLADPGVQDRRAGVMVPGGQTLHAYANLYINGRNPMLYRLVRNNPPQQIVVVAVSPDVLDLPGVVITAANAASSQPHWMASPDGLAEINRDYVYARSWLHDNDAKEQRRHILGMCAEVLVPESVEPDHLIGLHVSCAETRNALVSAGVPLPVDIRPDLFFGYTRAS